MEKVALKYGMASLAAASISRLYLEKGIVDLDNSYIRMLNTADGLAAAEIKIKYEQFKQFLGEPYDDISSLGNGWYKQTYTTDSNQSLKNKLEKALKNASKAGLATLSKDEPFVQKAYGTPLISKLTNASKNNIKTSDDTAVNPISKKAATLVQAEQQAEAEEEPVTITPTAIFSPLYNTGLSFAVEENETTSTKHFYEYFEPKEFTLKEAVAGGYARYKVSVLSEGAIFYNVKSRTGPYVIYGPTYKKYKELDEELGKLGFPTSDVTTNAEMNVLQHFENGCIYRRKEQQIVLDGSIYKKWVSMGGENCYLGIPKTNVFVETVVYDDSPVVMSLHTVPTGNEHAYFDQGLILKAKGEEPHAIHEKIYTEWLRPRNGVLTSYDYGRVLSDTSINGEHLKNYFKTKEGEIFSISWSPISGYVHETLTDEKIRHKYEQFASIMGVRSDRTQTSIRGWIKLLCENGAVYYLPPHGASDPGPIAVYGDIYTKYVNMGSERGPLGYPKRDTCKTPDKIGSYTHFENGSIYWSPQTGAHEMHGDILKKYAKLGWETGELGYPMTDELIAPDGEGRYNHFQGGAIYWTLKKGAFVVPARILAVWKQKSYEKGSLGYPLEDACHGSRDTDLIHQRFQGGEISFGTETAYRVHEPKVYIAISLQRISCESTFYHQQYEVHGWVSKGFEDVRLTGYALDNNGAKYNMTNNGWYNHYNYSFKEGGSKWTTNEYDWGSSYYARYG